jgi:hypothetical protein
MKSMGKLQSLKDKKEIPEIFFELAYEYYTRPLLL